MHVFLTGPVQIGKSTLIAAALDTLQPERLGGFRTVSAKPEADGSRPVYLHRERNGKTGDAQNRQQRACIDAERPGHKHDGDKDQNRLGRRAQEAENGVVKLRVGKQLVRHLQNQPDQHRAQNQQNRRVQQLLQRQL